MTCVFMSYDAHPMKQAWPLEDNCWELVLFLCPGFQESDWSQQASVASAFTQGATASALQVHPNQKKDDLLTLFQSAMIS